MVEINGHDLSYNDLVKVARHGEPVSISVEGVQAINTSRKRLERIFETNRPVYGINTGFGIFAEYPIPSEASAKLSRNLILSHAVGTGEPLSKEIVRAGMLVRANTLAKGYSGVRLEVVQTLIDMLNKGVSPVIPSQGSLGSSGDLCPLSHLALVFTTEEDDREEDSGWAEHEGMVMTGKAAMAAAGIPRVILGPKEGLALNNGATFSAAITALAIVDAEYLLKVANASLALSLEAMMGCLAAFDARIHDVRGHEGQQYVAESVRLMTNGSTLLDASGRVQDAYSLRCAPQVHGPVLETVQFIKNIVERELNAATDNPLIFEPEDVLSGGNFHGEPIGLAADYLSISMSELGAISERRIFRMTDGKLNFGLPPMLVDSQEAAGLNSGLMIPQYTAASLVLENQSLSAPDSVHSLPTSAEQEDHNANSMTAARHARQVLANVGHVLAIELYTAARAIDLRIRQVPRGRLGKGTRAVYKKIRKQVPYQPGDAWWGPEIDLVKKMIEDQALFPVDQVVDKKNIDKAE